YAALSTSEIFPQHSLLAGSLATVGVVEADDIIFAEIGATLNLNDFQVHLAGVFQAMGGAQRDKGGLVFSQQQGFFATGDLGGAAHHDPVLGAVVVHLQRQLFSRFYRDAFDLKTVAVVNGVIVSPGSEHLAVEQVAA